MNAVSSAAQSPRARLVAADLRQVRWNAEHFASAATIHKLSNYVLTIQAALQLVDARLVQGQVAEVDMLLDLAEQRVRDCRALLAQSRKHRFANRQTVSRVAA